LAEARFTGTLLALTAICWCGAATAATYRSPYAVVASPDGATAYVSDHTANCVVVLDLAAGKPKAQWPVGEGPAGLALAPDGKTLYVALQKANEVAILSTAGGKVVKRIGVGYRPTGLALAPKRQVLYVCNRGENTVSFVDMRKGAEKFRVRMVREPIFAAVTPDESKVVVSNALAFGPATESTTAASVNIFDAGTAETGTTVKLPGGSTNCRCVAVSPDGKWAFVVHGVSRFQVPTTQLERGWMNTSALSIIDLANESLYATVLLDSIDLGAADPWGLALSPDGKFLWVSLSGVHEVARIEVARLVEMLSGKVPDKYARPLGTANVNPWALIKRNPDYRYELVNDLMAMYFAELIERYPSDGKRFLVRLGEDRLASKGPRCIALTPDGKRLLVPNYYGGTVTVLDTSNGKLVKAIAVGPQPEPDVVRKGEIVFHDASICFQHWQSCATCHPDGRMDGLRWDLLNDGMGNHKKTRWLVYSHRVRPVMSMGVRARAEVAVRAGFHHILFAVVPEETACAVDEYLKSLRPDPNPYRTRDGKLTEAARRGKRIFEGKARCATCHRGPLYTDMKPYDVGTRGPYDREGDKFYTPKLIEIYRVAPYLHDGRAATLREVITKFNPGDRHGATSNLTEQEIDDLVAYLKSL